MRRISAYCLLIIVSVCLLLAFASAGPLMAVDFGGESVRVSVVKPGRNPISVVLNEASKRKTGALVGFINGDRLLGEEAVTASARHPDKVFARARDLLGKQAGDKAVQQLLEKSRLPYKIVPASPQRGAAAIQTQGGEVYSAEELVASLLHYARGITEAAAEGAAILDCVITVPPFWGPNQRQALVDAARVAGLNVLALINSHAAAALQYGIERDFTNRSELVILYDMGGTSTEAALVEFSSFTVKEAGKPKTYGQFEVKDVAWDASLGGDDFEALLVDRFADEFTAANPGLDPRFSPKAVAKLRRQAKRTKEVLSANSFAPVSVEELMEGLDFRSRIERSEFESLAAPLLDRAAQPLRRLVERSGVAVADLAAVELLGGGSRVPAVKAALSQTLGGRALDMHLDADEAVVLGAGLFAANLSTTFRLRKFGMTDGIIYPVAFQLEAPEGVVLDESAEKHFVPKALLPRMKRLPARRSVPLPAIPGVKSLTARLSFNTSDPTIGLPPGAASPDLATFEISGFKEVEEKYNDTGKLSMTIRADESGLVALEKAEAAVEITEEYTVTLPPPPPKNDSSAGEEAAAGEGTGNATEPEQVVKTRQRTIRVPLAVGGPGLTYPGLSAEELQASRQVLKQLAAREAAKQAASVAKNGLEAYIIRLRGRLSDESDVAAVTLEAQRTTLLEALDAAEEWLYEEPDDSPASVFQSKLAELKKEGDPIELRARELKALPKTLKNAADFVGVTRQAVGGWKSTKPWLNATDVDALKAQIDEFEGWMSKAAKAQAKLKPHAEPQLLSSQVDDRLAEVRKSFERLKNKKKPKPPPAPKPKANATAAEAPTAAPETQESSTGEEPSQEQHDEL